MNQIPEGTEQIWVEAVYKEPIEGIPFSNVGLTLGVTRYVTENSKEEQKVLDEQINSLVKSYFDKLSSEIKSTRNELIDKVRIELAEEYKTTYEDKFEKAKAEILRLRQLCKDNNINYNNKENGVSN